MKRNAMLVAATLPLAACALETDREQEIRAPAVEVAGEPSDCIQTGNITNVVVQDDYTIDFKMIGGRVYRNALPNRCHGLGFEKRIIYEPHAGQLCRVETIGVLRPDSLPGPRCSLGEFVPVRYVDG